MAILHQATLTPTKRELLQAWLPGRAWSGGAASFDALGAYRFDDPAGEVGMEGFLLDAGEAVLHVPLTYRGAPLDGAEEHLLGTTEHSVLGTRWVYDACGDPVFADVLARTVLTGGTEAGEEVEVDGVRQARQPSATVAGSGRPGTEVPELEALSVHDDGDVTLVGAGPLTLVVVHRVGAEPEGDLGRLTGQWDGSAPVVLAAVRAR